MTDGLKLDFSELAQLGADLGKVPETAGPFLNSALQFTSKEVARAAQRKVGKRRHFKQAAAAIDYEVTTFQGFGVSVIQSEIGYDKEKSAGSLGNLIEFGAPGSLNALTPGNELVTSLHEQEDDFEKGLLRATEDAERKVGL